MQRLAKDDVNTRGPNTSKPQRTSFVAFVKPPPRSGDANPAKSKESGWTTDAGVDILECAGKPRPAVVLEHMLLRAGA